jgi:putative autoinducer-2 (AI-2) aldolase
VAEGAAGVDMGRNIFQSVAPVAMLQAIRSVVHDRLPPAQAHEQFLDLAAQAGVAVAAGA